METLKISPTLLEQYRICRVGLFDKTMQDFDKYVRKEIEYSNEMSFGRAFQLVIENGAEQYKDIAGLYNIEGLYLTHNDIKAAIEYRAVYPNLIYEVPFYTEIEINGYKVKISGRMDGINGIVVHENKTTAYYRGVDGYEESYQWMMYLLYSESPVLQYNIFEVNQKKSGKNVKRYSFKLYPFLGMQDKIENAISDMIIYLQENELINRIKW